MNPTYEELKAKYDTIENRKAVACAAIDEKEIECYDTIINLWCTRTFLKDKVSIDFSWLHRIKPTPELVPWTAEDVPGVCWIKFNGSAARSLVSGVTKSGVYIHGHFNNWGELSRDSTWSDRPFGEYKPCSKIDLRVAPANNSYDC